MPVVIAYAILEGETKQKLEALVKEFISKGWQPIGGVAIAEGHFYQSVVGH